MSEDKELDRIQKLTALYQYLLDKWKRKYDR